MNKTSSMQSVPSEDFESLGNTPSNKYGGPYCDKLEG